MKTNPRNQPSRSNTCAIRAAKTLLPPAVVGAVLTILLAAILASSPSVLRADTVIMVPPSNKDAKVVSPICLGQAIVEVDFSKANFNPKFSEPAFSKRPCLLMGMINGRPVVIDVDQNPEYPTFNTLYFVTIVDDKHASFSGLLEDCIGFEGFQGQKVWAYMNRDIAFSGPPLNNRRGQLLHWTFPPSDPTKPETAKQMVLMINGCQKGGVDFFSLMPDPVKSGNAQVIKKIKLVWNKRRYLGNFDPDRLKGSDLYITSLDCIDLNGFKNADNNTNYNKTLVVGCKPDGMNGCDNLQLSAPKYLFFCPLENDVDAPIDVCGKYEFYLKPCKKPARDTDDGWDNVVGGFVMAPTNKGQLRYWFAISAGEKTHEWRNDHYWFAVNLTTNSIGLKYDENKKVVLPSTIGYNYQHSYKRTSSKYWKTDAEPLFEFLMRAYEVEFGGPRFVIEDDENNTVRLNACGPDYSQYQWKAYGDDKIGITESMSEKEINDLNKDIDILGGPINRDSDTPEAKAARLTRLNKMLGSTVFKVFLGWPYTAIPQKDNAITEKYPQFVVTKSNTKITQQSYNDGVAANVEVGWVVGVDKIWGFGLGVKSGYEFKYDRTKNNSIEVSESTIVDALMKPESLEDAKRMYGSGVVFVTRVGPRITRVSNCIPFKGSKGLTIDDGNATPRFFCPTVGVQIDGGSQGVLTTPRFLCSDPSNMGRSDQYTDWEDRTNKEKSEKRFVTDYQPFTDGLLKRTVNSLIQYNPNDPADFDNKLDVIRKWQDANPLVKDIESFNSKGSGVSPYDQDKGYFKGTFSNTAACSIIIGNNEVETYSNQGYLGIYANWTSHPLGGVTMKGDIVWKTGSSYVYTKSNKDAFMLNVPGHGEKNKLWYYYIYNIDIPALKSYMLSHSYTLYCNERGTKGDDAKFTNEAVRPTFIPKWSWENNQSFVLGFPWIPPGSVNTPQATASSN